MYIYSNDGQTLLAFHDMSGGGTLKLVSDGVMFRYPKEDPEYVYTYSGSSTFLGLATSANQTTPAYSAPSSAGWENGVEISNGTYYIVESTSVLKYVGETALSELVTKTKQLVATKQDTLVSGTNIKTINNESLLGSGNISAETTSNKVTTLSSSSTDTQYPSAKCVYDLVGDVETLLTALNSGQGV